MIPVFVSTPRKEGQCRFASARDSGIARLPPKVARVVPGGCSGGFLRERNLRRADNRDRRSNELHTPRGPCCLPARPAAHLPAGPVSPSAAPGSATPRPPGLSCAPQPHCGAPLRAAEHTSAATSFSLPPGHRQCTALKGPPGILTKPNSGSFGILFSGRAARSPAGCGDRKALIHRLWPRRGPDPASGVFGRR